MVNQKKGEIDLNDYIYILFKRKKLIASLFITSTCIIAALFLLKPKTYQAEAIIQIASLQRPIFSKEEVRELILSQNILTPVYAQHKDILQSCSISDLRNRIDIEFIKETPYVKLALKDSDPHSAKVLIKSIVEEFFRFSNRKYQKHRTLFENQLETMESQIEATKDGINDVNKQINLLSGVSSQIEPETMSKILLLKNMLNDLRIQYSDLLEKRSNIQLTLINNDAFEVINGPETYSIPGRTVSKIVLAGIMCFICSVFFAFSLEFIYQPFTVKKK